MIATYERHSAALRVIRTSNKLSLPNGVGTDVGQPLSCATGQRAELNVPPGLRTGRDDLDDAGEGSQAWN